MIGGRGLFFRRGVVKNVSGSYNAVYILPRALYTKMDQTLIYSVATGIIGGKETMTQKQIQAIDRKMRIATTLRRSSWMR